MSDQEIKNEDLFTKEREKLTLIAQNMQNLLGISGLSYEEIAMVGSIILKEFYFSVNKMDEADEEEIKRKYDIMTEIHKGLIKTFEDNNLDYGDLQFFCSTYAQIHLFSNMEEALRKFTSGEIVDVNEEIFKEIRSNTPYMDAILTGVESKKE